MASHSQWSKRWHLTDSIRGEQKILLSREYLLSIKIRHSCRCNVANPVNEARWAKQKASLDSGEQEEIAT
jgi:hypothetical protein